MTQFNDSVVKAALRYASDEGLSTTSNNFNDLVWLSLYNYLTGTVGLVLSPTVSLNELITLTAANYLSVPWGQMDQLVFDALGVYLQGKVDPIPGSLNGRIIEASEFFSNRPVGPPPVNTVAPAITGTPNVGNVLTVSNGTWDNTPTGYTYTWQISIDGLTAWSDIPGETTNTYTIGAEMESYYIRAIVTASNEFGNASAPSNVVGPVIIQTLAEYIASATMSTGTISPPVGAAPGDLGIICICYSSDTGGATFPAGWTTIARPIYTSNRTMTVGWKVMDASDFVNPVITGISDSNGIFSVYRGATGVRERGFKSNATNVGAVVVPNGTQGADAKGAITFAIDRDSTGSATWTAGAVSTTGWTKKQNQDGSFAIAMADTLGAIPDQYPGPLQTDTAWVVTNGSYGECGIVLEMY